MPPLDNIRSVQRLSYLALEFAEFYYKMTTAKNHSLPKLHANIVELIKYLTALCKVYSDN